MASRLEYGRSFYIARYRAVDDRGEGMATDDEIQRIIDDNEAGIADLLEAYLNVERFYSRAVTRLIAPEPPPSYATSNRVVDAPYRTRAAEQ
jgi:hypothetical protein